MTPARPLLAAIVRQVLEHIPGALLGVAVVAVIRRRRANRERT